MAIYNGLSFFVSEILTWIPVLQQLTLETSDWRVTLMSLILLTSLLFIYAPHNLKSLLSILILSLITSLEIYYPGPGQVVTTEHAQAGNDHNE